MSDAEEPELPFQVTFDPATPKPQMVGMFLDIIANLGTNEMVTAVKDKNGMLEIWVREKVTN